MAKPFVIDVDLKRESYIEKFKVTSNDTNTFVINIFDDGVKFDMSNITMATIAHTRIDGAVVVKEGTVGTNQVTFVLGSTETAVTGRVEATVQLYVGVERVSSLLFTYEVKRDATGNGFIPSEFDKTLIQVVLGDGPVIIQEAIDAALYANAEADATKEERLLTEQARVDLADQLVLFEISTEEERVARLAQQEAFEADVEQQRVVFEADVEQKRLTFETASEEDQAAFEAAILEEKEAFELAIESDRAEIRAQQAAFELATAQERVELLNRQVAYESGLITRVNDLETRVVSAETVANLAKARADLIIAQAGSANTEIVDSRLGADLVVRSTAGTLIREIHSAQLETARQTTTIGNGVSVVTGGVDALAETEIEGRTLISLGNSNLDATKQYVLADKKTKVLVDGVTQSGVAKFTKGTTTVSTANFVGKVANSTVVNPHLAYYLKGLPTLVTINTPMYSFTVSYYNMISSLDGTYTNSTNDVVSGNMAQERFSFDIIAEIERKLGIIPKSTVAEKVQWVKDNVELVKGLWYGFGSSPLGNKSTVAKWHVTNGTWSTTATSTNGSVTAHTAINHTPADYIDINGFVHILAYADASDGVTPSSISTDYIDLVVTLKATAQLNTRPTIIRVENFEGKVSGSVVENPHIFRGGSLSTLGAPGALTYESPSVSTDLKSLNGVIATISNSTSGVMAQHLFSFNLIEAVERNVGKIPRTSVADKRQWVIDNINQFVANWHGFGSSAGGNKASLKVYMNDSSLWSNNAWSISPTHTSATIARLASRIFLGDIAKCIDSNGFAHFIAYAEPSDGTTASTINTDYIDLEIEIKPTADFTRPKVALYEVTADSYAKILVDWSADEVVSRYPVVEGVQHLQGVGVLAEGENLLPDYGIDLMGTATFSDIKPYEMTIDWTGSLTAYLLKSYPVVPNTDYYMSFTTEIISPGSTVAFGFIGDKSTLVLSNNSKWNSGSNTKIDLVVNRGSLTGKLKLKNWTLTLGTTAKPFVPRNPSYLYADVKLGAIGTVADRLYEQDGSKYVRKVVEKDVVLGGDLAWIFDGDRLGVKGFGLSKNTNQTNVKSQSIFTKFDGKLIKAVGSDWTTVDEFSVPNTNLYLQVPDTDTGFGETYTPSVAEIKAYFYGYKINNGTFGVNYEATGTKTWIPISDTSNARAVTVVPTSASPTQLDGTIQPYKLSYVLATPQVINVTDKVEGQLKVNGLTQVEVLSGIVRREKAEFVMHAGGWSAVFNGGTSGSKYAPRRVARFISVFKNGQPIYFGVNNSTTWSNGQPISIKKEDFDPTAEYTVTYIALDKPLLTANPTNIKLLYANNMRSSLEDTVGKVQDNTTQLSVHEKAIVDLYVRVKALEVKVP